MDSFINILMWYLLLAGSNHVIIRTYGYFAMSRAEREGYIINPDIEKKTTFIGYVISKLLSLLYILSPITIINGVKGIAKCTLLGLNVSEQMYLYYIKDGALIKKNDGDLKIKNTEFSHKKIENEKNNSNNKSADKEWALNQLSREYSNSYSPVYYDHVTQKEKVKKYHK